MINTGTDMTDSMNTLWGEEGLLICLYTRLAPDDVRCEILPALASQNAIGSARIIRF